MINKGADQTAQMRRPICAFVVRIGHKEVFSWCGSNIPFAGSLVLMGKAYNSASIS